MEILDQLGITGSPAITVICFLAAEILKRFPLENKWIPVVCGCLGGLLGLCAACFFPDYPDENLYAAMSVGIISGFAATGVHQMYKRLVSVKEQPSEKEEQ